MDKLGGVSGECLIDDLTDLIRGVARLSGKVDEVVDWINAHEERELGHNIRTNTKPSLGE